MSAKFLTGRPTFGRRCDADRNGDLPFTKTEFRQTRRRLARAYGITTYEEALTWCRVYWRGEYG